MRLRTRLALAFALLAVVPLALVVPSSFASLRKILSEQLQSRVQSATTVTDTTLRELGQSTRRAIEELAQSAALEELARDIHAHAPPSRMVSTAEKLMTSRGLKVLSLLNADGVTLSSGHLPARLGDPDPALFAVAQSAGKEPVAALVEVRGEAGLRRMPALVTARSLDYGELRIWVVGGTLLDTELAEQLSQMTDARIEISSPEGLAAASGSAEPPTEDRVFRLPPSVEVKLSLSKAPIVSADKVQQRTFAVQVGIGLLLAILLGLLIARFITRPVEALTEASRRIAAGSFASQVEEKASGEVGELVRAFNRMTGDLQRTTEQLVASERVAAWQEVARRLAHEIKNPLTPIKMSLETLIAASEGSEARFRDLFRESANAVLEEVERLRRIVDEFSQFARLPKPELSRVDLSAFVQQVLSLYASPRGGIRIATELQPEVAVQVDRDQLTQVLLNLIKNAEEAVEDSGQILLRVRAVNQSAILEVQDSGPGVRPQDRERIFEPYFTTKQAGTGLGLAIARRICQEHRGQLEVDAAPAGGAVFRVVLPLEVAAGAGRAHSA